MLVLLDMGVKTTIFTGNIHVERREGTGLMTARQPAHKVPNPAHHGEHEVTLQMDRTSPLREVFVVQAGKPNGGQTYE